MDLMRFLKQTVLCIYITIFSTCNQEGICDDGAIDI